MNQSLSSGETSNRLGSTMITSVSPFLSVHEAVATVYPHRSEWKLLPAIEKANLIQECLSNLGKTRKQFETVGLERRNYCLKEEDKADRNKLEIFETEKALIPLLTSTHLAFWLSSLQRSYRHVASTGQFPKPLAVSLNADRTWRVDVSPTDYFTWTACGFTTLELHVENAARTKELPSNKEVSVSQSSTTGASENLEDLTQADDDDEGKAETTLELLESLSTVQHNALEYFKVTGGEVAAVLGAGNFDCPIDVLSAMFISNNVVVYKVSPLSEALVAPLTQIFSPLIKRGFLAFTSGGPVEGSQLLHHPDVSQWGMTGDRRTANRILFDSPESPFEDRAPGTVPAAEVDEKLKLKKPATIELGNCSPYIIVPGDWSDGELWRHARHLVLGLLLNGGHICARPQIIVTCKNWPQRETFLRYVRRSAMESKTGAGFYPNAAEKFQAYKEKLSQEGHQLEKIIVGSGNLVFASSASPTSCILTDELFCCVAGEFPLDTSTAISDFLPSAVEFVNTKAFGALAATIIAKTTTRDESEAVDDAILKLHYGSVGLNISGLLSVYHPQLVWGGCPHLVDLSHLQSGVGFFGNSHGFLRPRKSVLRCAFNGPNHFLQVVPRRHEIGRFQKVFARLTEGFCAQSHRASLVNYIKLGSGLIFNL